MSSAEFTPPYDVLAGNLAAVLNGRVALATSVELLSTQGDKILEVMEESNGQKFVRRSFSEDAVAEINRFDVGFREAWDAMHDVFGEVGIDIVPSGLIETEGEYPFVVISEYIEDAYPLVVAPVEAKKELARSLGRLLTIDAPLLPAMEMLNEELFLVRKDENGDAHIVLSDVDPLMTPANHLQGTLMAGSHFMQQISGLFWDSWCESDERQQVVSAFRGSVAEFALHGPHHSELTESAFIELQLMSNGLDPRAAGLFKK